jgi:hypothetical protein
MFEIVTATFGEIRVITKTPRKLNTDARIIALLGLITRVEIAVAIAFGASVQPLTSTTANVKMQVTSSAGLARTPVKNS